jgi:hypothetical protein
LSPRGKVRLFIAGSGNLKLLTKPEELRQTIVGSGEVNQLGAEAAKAALQASEAAIKAANTAIGSAQIGEQIGRQVRQQVEHEVDRQMRYAYGPPGAPIPPPPPNVIEKSNGSMVIPSYRDVDLGHIERESLTINIADSGSVTADGKVDRLTINIMGSGNANLGKLAARNVTVMVMGSGSATVAPSEDLKTHIMGSGDVHVLTKPARIERSIMGSGHVIEER